MTDQLVIAAAEWLRLHEEIERLTADRDAALALLREVRDEQRMMLSYPLLAKIDAALKEQP